MATQKYVKEVSNEKFKQTEKHLNNWQNIVTII